jgi:hypothetical protein
MGSLKFLKYSGPGIYLAELGDRFVEESLLSPVSDARWFGHDTEVV